MNSWPNRRRRSKYLRLLPRGAGLILAARFLASPVGLKQQDQKGQQRDKKRQQLEEERKRLEEEQAQKREENKRKRQEKRKLELEEKNRKQEELQKQEEEKRRGKEIIPGLYLGNRHVAKNGPWMEEYRCRYVVNVTSELRNHFEVILLRNTRQLTFIHLAGIRNHLHEDPGS